MPAAAGRILLASLGRVGCAGRPCAVRACIVAGPDGRLQTGSTQPNLTRSRGYADVASGPMRSTCRRSTLCVFDRSNGDTHERPRPPGVSRRPRPSPSSTRLALARVIGNRAEF